MVKFNWAPDKILLQRIFLVGLSAVIARDVLNGYLDYNKQVIEYMQSTSYRQALESSKKHRIKLMKSNQHLYYSAEAESFASYEDSGRKEDRE